MDVSFWSSSSIQNLGATVFGGAISTFTSFVVQRQSNKFALEQATKLETSAKRAGALRAMLLLSQAIAEAKSLPDQIQGSIDSARSEDIELTELWQTVGAPGYPASAGSAVTRHSPSTSACATSIRSNGSRCSGGSAATAQACAAADRQLLVAVLDQPAPQLPGVHREVGPAEARLDRHLPEARGAEDQRVAGILDQRRRRHRSSPAPPPPRAAGACRGAASRAAAEQRLHLRRADAVEVVGHAELAGEEAQAPPRPGRGRRSATTRTSGLPALAMTKLSPLAAASTSRESWVFASWMLTVRIGALQVNQTR